MGSTLGWWKGLAKMEVREGLPRRGEVQTSGQDGPHPGSLCTHPQPIVQPRGCKGQEGCWQDWPRADIDPLPIRCAELGIPPRAAPVLWGTREEETNTWVEAEPGSEHSPGAPARNWSSTPQLLQVSLVAFADSAFNQNFSYPSFLARWQVPPKAGVLKSC